MVNFVGFCIVLAKFVEKASVDGCSILVGISGTLDVSRDVSLILNVQLIDFVIILFGELTVPETR